MKFKNLIFSLFILIATAMLAIFIYDTLNADNLVEVSANHNIVLNNQISIRDIKNVTSNLTSNNVTFPTNPAVNTTTSTTVITIASIVGGGLVLIALGFILATYGILPNPLPGPAHAEAIRMAGAGEFLDNN